MTKSTQIFYTIIIIIALALTYNCSKDRKNHTLTIEDAGNIMSSYMSVLNSGDIGAIKKYWSNESLNRKGFDVMHLWIGKIIHITEWKYFLDSTKYTYHVKELSAEDDYYVVNGEWKKPGGVYTADETHPMTFYLVYENNNWLLINPIDVLPRNWNHYETDNITFFYPRNTEINDHLHEMKLLDREYQSMCKAMEFSIDGKIEYYKASCPEECGKLLTQPPVNGLAAVTYRDSVPWFQIAVSTTFYNPHEVMHIISLSSGIPSRFPAFSEGLAVAYGGTSFHTAKYAHNYSKNILGNTNYIPIKTLLTMSGNDFFRSNYITYQESGSFIRYLLNEFGIDRLKSFISNFDLDINLNDLSEKVYNSSIDDLEKKWKESLMNIKLPEINFSIPDGAESVFSMTDPENDDNGDGDYKYPSNEKYVKGCFDLTKFEVFRENDNVYFKIGLQNVIEPISNRPRGVKFIPAIVIAINRGNLNERQLYKYTNEVEIIDGYDLKINVGFGINVSNNFGKIFLSTSDLYKEMADLISGNLIFSLPTEIVGDPDADWKYFVGVGLTDEPTFNFSGLTPVFKNAPQLISGGNYDYSNPAFIDILLADDIDQTEILSNYDSESRKLASIRMVSKMD